MSLLFLSFKQIIRMNSTSILIEINYQLTGAEHVLIQMVTLDVDQR